MDKRKRRRKRKEAFNEVMDIVRTVLLVVIAIAAVVFVIVFIKEQLGSADAGDSKMSVFSSLFRGKDQEETASAETTDRQMDVETEVREGLNRDEEGRYFYVKNGKTVTDCWLDCDKSLYRLDEEGYAVTGAYEEDAFIYQMSSSGRVQTISWNESYQDSAPQDMPGLVKNSSFSVYLNHDTALGRFSAIVYKKTTVSHKLGGDENLQYTRAGSIQTDAEGYIYWLPVVSSPDEQEEKINRKLYRMLPDAETRQIVAEDVDGYRVLTGQNGETVIYYCRGGGLYRCGSANCRDDIYVPRFTEDMEYELDLTQEGKLILKTASGYPVAEAFDSFRTGGFTYRISDTGEILSREDQVEADVGVDIYSILSDEVFNSLRSVVTKEDGEGDRYMISGDFPGECRSLYLNDRDGRLYAEYTATDGTPGVLVITKDGDVDLLLDREADAEFAEIYGFTAGGVVVRITDPDGKVYYTELDGKESSPLALGIDPVKLSEDGETTEETASAVEQLGPGYAGSYGPDMSSSSGNSQPGGESPSGTGSGISAAPGSLPQPTAEIPDQPVTVSQSP